MYVLYVCLTNWLTVTYSLHSLQKMERKLYFHLTSSATLCSLTATVEKLLHT